MPEIIEVPDWKYEYVYGKKEKKVMNEDVLTTTLSKMHIERANFTVGHATVCIFFDFNLGKHRFSTEGDLTSEELKHVLKFIDDFERSEFVVTCG